MAASTGSSKNYLVSLLEFHQSTEAKGFSEQIRDGITSRLRMSIDELGQHQMIKTHLLKVHVNCLGCQRKVKKLLRKIHGVFSVHIDPEQELVTVSGTVDSDVLIEKLAGSGKHAELLLPDHKANLKQEEDGSKTYSDNDIQILRRADSMPSTFFEGDRTRRNYLTPNIGERTLMGRSIDAVRKGDMNSGVYTQRNGLGYAGSGGHQIDYQTLSTIGRHLPPMPIWARPYQYSAPEIMHIYDPDKPMMNEGPSDYNSYLSWPYGM
ncbi:hypothetical protein BT93_L4008 [Corymbia citriodora subsp. variegata]|uniref:HMA domain-containing protein n=1 Tax=Corymbia citriodora subsp. variegata TaxID=360336 RepID=A0A8T0CYT4_CORYI|nr:hypothetical protein BT93_L4008 [Corymbia citriodora subsp. variegata]